MIWILPTAVLIPLWSLSNPAFHNPFPQSCYSCHTENALVIVLLFKNIVIQSMWAWMCHFLLAELLFNLWTVFVWSRPNIISLYVAFWAITTNNPVIQELIHHLQIYDGDKLPAAEVLYRIFWTRQWCLQENRNTATVWMLYSNKMYNLCITRMHLEFCNLLWRFETSLKNI